MMQKRIDQRPVPLATCWMDNDPWSFINHDAIIVFKQDTATGVLPGRLGKQTHDREGCDALTTAALTYYTYLLAWLDQQIC